MIDPEVNPYASPRSDVGALNAQPTDSPDEIIRRENIRHEVSLKSVGLLYLAGAIALVLVGTVFCVTSILAFVAAGGEPSPEDASLLPVGIFQMTFSVLFVFMWRGFRTLQPWVRIPGTVLSVLVLLSIPVGTIIGGYVLYLLHSQKGKTVFSDDYKLIIAQTPQVTYGMPPLLIGLAGFAVVTLVAWCVAVVMLG